MPAKEDPSYHMSPEAFRAAGHQLVEWVARYMEEVGSFPVRSQAVPGQISAALPEHPPMDPEPLAPVLRDLDAIVMPGITHWQSPNFFAYFPANASGPAILGDLLSAGLGVQGMLWETSPACTELEMRMLDWLAEALGLPESFRNRTGPGGGVIQDSASSALLCALIAARERATAGAANKVGARQELAVYGSSQTHSSLLKAVRITGIGADNLREVATDASGAMVPEALQAAISGDRSSGRAPALICATIGTTASNAIDPVAALGPIARREGAWLHVDAAMSGTAAICPEFRWLHQGIEYADSYCFNPHKWMFTNFDCDCFWVADRQSLTSALTIMPEYLRNRPSESGAVFDYRDWQVPLGRRFRALKLWMVLRHYGLKGLAHHIRQHVALAAEFASWVAADDNFELLAPPPLNLVCFYHRQGEQRTLALRDALNDSGALYLSHGKLGGQTFLRMSIGGIWTTHQHVKRAWEAIAALGRDPAC